MKFLTLEWTEFELTFGSVIVEAESFYILDSLANTHVLSLLPSSDEGKYNYSLHNSSFDIDINLNLNYDNVISNSYSLFTCRYVDKSLPASENVNLVAIGASFLKFLKDDLPSNNGGSILPFNYLDLNGNCGSFKNGSVVNVLGKIGDYIVKSSQFVWDDTTKKNSMVIYSLEKDGTMMFASDPLVSLKVAP